MKYIYWLNNIIRYCYVNRIARVIWTIANLCNLYFFIFYILPDINLWSLVVVIASFYNLILLYATRNGNIPNRWKQEK